MPDTIDIGEKSSPVRLLESRRLALIKWIGDGEATIANCEAVAQSTKEQTVEMLKEIDEIEIALKTLHTQSVAETPDAA